jgi:hypothetical protein
VVLEIDDYGDQAFVESLLARVIRGEEELTTEDGVPVRALLCSAVYTSGTTVMSLADDDVDGLLDDDNSGSSDGSDGSGSGADNVVPSAVTSGKPRRGRMRAVTGGVASGIAAAVMGTLLFGLIVVFRGQLRRRWRGQRGGKVLQAGTNVVSTVAAASSPLSPPEPSSAAAPPPPPSPPPPSPPSPGPNFSRSQPEPRAAVPHPRRPPF